MSEDEDKAIILEEDKKTILIVNPNETEANKLLNLIQETLPEEYKILIVGHHNYPVKNDVQDLIKLLEIREVGIIKYAPEPQEKYYQKYNKSYNKKHKTHL